MATSRFQDIRTALAAAITAQLATDSVIGVSVFRIPRTITPIEEQVYVFNIRGEQVPATQGPSGLRKEDLEIDVMIEVPRSGTTGDEFEEAEARAEEIMASIENTTRTDPTFGGVLLNSEFDSFETDHQFSDQTAWGRIEILITGEAYL